MCGIAGSFHFSGKRAFPAERIAACGYALSHRGPDGEGTFRRGNVLLCHRRLAIIDTNARADQPMALRCPMGARALHIVFNGEIYNYQGLKTVLQQLGHAFRTGSDTEVLLHGFEQWGTACFEKLRGMFAFALWDEDEKKLYLARDRFGIKPLYYVAQKEYVAFASEMRALRKLTNVPPKVRPGAVFEFLSQGYLNQPDTFYDGMRSVDPGTFITVSLSGAHVERFFDVASYYSQRKSPYPFDEAVHQLKGVLEDSARHHMIADVPVGLFLSGGIDSTALLVSLREQGYENLRTVSAVFPGTPYDESAHVHALTERFGVDHSDVPVEENDFLMFLDRIFEYMDQPTSDGVNTFFVSLAAKQAGLKAVLSGLGGDEVFYGYPSFRRVPRLMRLRPLLRLAQGTGVLQGLSLVFSNAYKLAAMGQSKSVLGAWGAYRSLFGSAQIQKLMPGEAAAGAAEESEFGEAGHSKLQCVSYYELTRYMRNQLLRDSDVFSMAHSIELRVPFVDDFVVKFAAALPDAYKMSPGRTKRILKEVIRGAVPQHIVDAPKKGFVLPMALWLKGKAYAIMRGELADSEWFSKDEVERVLASFERGKLHWSRVWALFVLNRFLNAL